MLNATVVGPSAAALATAAKQPALGTAGTPSADVITVQGPASGGDALPVSAASGAYASGAFASGSGVDGWNVTEGTKADAAWTSGSGSLIAIAKAIATNTGAAIPACGATPCTTTIGNVGPAAMTPAAATAHVITTGGTAVTFVTGPVRGCLIVNPLSATDQGISTAEPLYVNPVTTATTTGNSTTTSVPPGGQWNCVPGQSTNVSANAATSSHAAVVIVW